MGTYQSWGVLFLRQGFGAVPVLRRRAAGTAPALGAAVLHPPQHKPCSFPSCLS